MRKKGTPSPATPGRVRPFQKAVRVTGSKTAAAVPCLDAGVKRNHPSQENAASQRSLPHTIRILRRFFLFIFCDTNAGINGEYAKTSSLSEDNFHKKSFMQSCEMIFLQNFFKYLINFIYRLQTFTCDDANIFASSASLFPVVRPWQGLTRSFRSRGGWSKGTKKAGKRSKSSSPPCRRVVLRPSGSGCPSADGPSFPSWYAGRIRFRGRLRSRWARVPRSPCRNRTDPRSSWGCWSAGGSW